MAATQALDFLTKNVIRGLQPPELIPTTMASEKASFHQGVVIAQIKKKRSLCKGGGRGTRSQLQTMFVIAHLGCFRPSQANTKLGEPTWAVVGAGHAHWLWNAMLCTHSGITQCIRHIPQSSHSCVEAIGRWA